MTIKAITTTHQPVEEQFAPIVVKLGKTKRSRIKDLEQGRGKLMEEVQGVMDQVRNSLGAEGDNVQLVPVVIVYKQKPKRRAGRVGLLGL